MIKIISPKSERASKMNGKIMTIKELSNYLNINEKTIYKLAEQGELPGVKKSSGCGDLKSKLLMIG